MTPKRDEWEEKLNKETEEQCFDSAPVTKVYFQYGATWAREQTIKEVIEALRELDRFEYGGKDCIFWADWLEERFKEKK